MAATMLAAACRPVGLLLQTFKMLPFCFGLLVLMSGYLRTIISCDRDFSPIAWVTKVQRVVGHTGGIAKSRPIVRRTETRGSPME